jgi:peptidoglycan L-alanyl-D-glutamate endopeptidase CwlK
MVYHLSKKSYKRLEGVNPQLVETVEKAIKLSSVDFGVIYGVRTLAEQQKLYDAGRSQTMRSKHLLQDDDTSHAVDLMAYDGKTPCWELVMYDDIADAMKQAAKETGAKIRWGAAWNIDNIAEWDRPMEDAMNHYIDVRRNQGRRPFIDGPHFELN